MATKKNDDVVKEIVKKKPRGVPIQETLAPKTEPGDNAKYISVSLKLFNMPSIELKDVEVVEQRLSEYFQIHYEADLKPTVAGMAMALGISRQQLWSIRTGQPYSGNGGVANVPTPVSNAIKKAYDFMENLWENYMQNGKINPVSGIFLGKNNFGYQDKTEYVVTPNVNSDFDYNADDIKKRYLTDSPTLELPEVIDSQE